MFNLLSSALQSAVETLLVEEHAEILIQGGGKEETGSQTEPGPCMETVLENRMFGKLAQRARDDWPSGFKCHVLKFFIELLDIGIPASLLPHKAIFGPLMETIQVCGETNASPYEKEELEFLKAMSLKLKRFSDLAPCFLIPLNADSENPQEESKVVDPENAYFPIVRSFLCLMLSADYWISLEASHALLEFASCLDDWLCPALVAPVHVTFPEQRKCCTSLPEFLIERMVESFVELPKNLDPDKLEESNWRLRVEPEDEDWLQDLKHLGVKAKNVWETVDTTVTKVVDDALGAAGQSANRIAKEAFDFLSRGFQQLQFELDLKEAPDDEDVPVSDEPMESPSHVLEPTSRKVLSYLSRLDLADVFAASTPSLAAKQIGSCFGVTFLRDAIERRLFDPDPAVALLATSHLTKVVQQVSSGVLLKEISDWLLGANRLPEIRGKPCHLLKALLLERCRQSEDIALALETLRLFEVLLQKPCEDIIFNLVLANLVDRRYVNVDKLMNQCSSWSDEEEEREKKRAENGAFSPNSTPRSRTLAPTKIQRIVNEFLDMVPDCLRSSGEDDAGPAGATYEQYLADAHRQTRNALSQCRSFAWPREATSNAEDSKTTVREHDENSSSDSRPESDRSLSGAACDKSPFYEGSFLEMILDRFDNILDQIQIVGSEAPLKVAVNTVWATWDESLLWSRVRLTSM
ncbi:unnamed protein product [Notodromas monacha]|uniref:Uncharacterized protein n=1 Tax=Notodromas monacha TaxID=399045 RepID=A0A7R9BQZ9_9CRUS|nr:unnamed protein product [Notodromas monacha]CAG0918568.1 unnamed protein product [Notodromas monacha]